EQVGRTWRIAVAALAVGLLLVGLFAWQSQRRAGTATVRLAEAERQIQAASDAANQRIAATRDDAAKQVAQARDTALKAQTVSDVLAAPDLVRYNLTGGDGVVRYSGQVLWSRTHGFVLSASRLPAPPQGSTYQIWLLTNTAPVSAGVFLPDQ